MKTIFKFPSLLVVIATMALVVASCEKKETPKDDIPEKIQTPNDSTDPVELILSDGQNVTSLGDLYVSTEYEGGSSGVHGSPKLVDGSADTKFLTEHTADFFIQMTFPQPITLGAYEITSGDDFNVRDPRDWTFSASSDSINWVVLDRRVMEDFSQRKLGKRYDFHNVNAYRYYRLNITATHWDHYLQMSELRLYTVFPSSQTYAPETIVDTFQQNNLSLVFIDNTPGGMDATQKNGLINVFFTNYPQLMTDFNPGAATLVYFKIATDYDGIATTNAANAVVHFGVDYMSTHTADIDVATHELMHIIEDYPIGPGWISEGIADYVRHVYGLNNAAAGWALSAPTATTHYTNGYGDAARFFLWLEHHVKAGIVTSLNTAMHTGVYTDQFWETETGKDVDQLWTDYINNPQI